MKRSIVPLDTETGEVVQGITMIDADGWQQILERKKEREARELRRMDHGPLGKFYLSACRTDQFEGLSPQDVTRLIFLASHLNYERVLMVSERKKLTLDDFPKVLGVSRATAKRFWNNVENRYISHTDDGSLIVTGTFFRGEQKHVTERLTKFFIEAVKKLYRATPISKHSCLGRIFQLLAHINVEFNILCHNPEETDLSNVAPMTFKEFCTETGYDSSKAHRLAQDLTAITFDVDGEQRHFIAFVTTEQQASSNQMIVINPRVLYGGSSYEKVEAFALFFK